MGNLGLGGPCFCRMLENKLSEHMISAFRPTRQLFQGTCAELFLQNLTDQRLWRVARQVPRQESCSEDFHSPSTCSQE